MSRTYLATETALGRQVVIKVLAPDLLAGISVERFRREVLLAARLQHPHVVPVLSTGETGGVPWFSMPYVDGDSLRQRLEAGPLGITEMTGLMRDVARALAYAHSHGIVHRDIKPDNVLVSAGSATVTDFGIAKAISAARTQVGGGGATLTQAGTAIGTPAYMSPEQVLGDEVDHRTDIYSFGVMAWELLAGHAPFRATSSAKLVAAHLTEVPRNIADVRQDCPSALAALVMQCMSKEPDERPQSAAELISVLDTAGTGDVTAAPRGERMRLSRALTLWAAATVAVTLVAWVLTQALGLPDWVTLGSLGVMMLGAPAVLLTAYVQRVSERISAITTGGGPRNASREQGTIANAALRVSPHLSWRRTWMGGVAAVGAFFVLVAGSTVLGALGVGPMATLQAKGQFGAQETLVVTDFRSPAGDADLGSTIAEALRTDLGQSQSLKVLTRAALRDRLTRMNRADVTLVDFQLAREIATREGAKAVLDGEVMKVGQGYVLSARLIAALDGTELATFRREAHSESDLLPELGKLSRSVRERAGESLRDIRATRDVERVTTPSLPALRQYVEGMRKYSQDGDRDGAVAHLLDAVALDSAFAMAWRAIAVVSNSQFIASRDGAVDALATAYRHRDRLTDSERLLTEATYFTDGPERDFARAEEALEKLIKLDSTSVAALNNISNLYSYREDHAGAERYLRAALAQTEAFAPSYSNLIGSQIRNGRSAASIDSTVTAYRQRFPNSKDLTSAEITAAWGTGRYSLADSLARAAFEKDPDAEEGIRAAWKLGDLASMAGKPNEALHWYSVITEKISSVIPAVYTISAGMDTAYHFGVVLGDAERGKAYLERAFDHASMEDVSVSNRRWAGVMEIAVETADSVLAKQTVMPYLRDAVPLAVDSAGERSHIMGQLMQASRRWDEAIDLYHKAYAARSMERSYYLRWVAASYDGAGNADSAIVWFERFLANPDPESYGKAYYVPPIHRRLGELYEARGDVAQAQAHYAAFVNFWQDAEPELQPDVQEIRRRIDRLRDGRG